MVGKYYNSDQSEKVPEEYIFIIYSCIFKVENPTSFNYTFAKSTRKWNIVLKDCDRCYVKFILKNFTDIA